MAGGGATAEGSGMFHHGKSAIGIGVGGWSYEPWRDTFYPPGLPQHRELEYASGRLTSLEINATYYHWQKAETFAKWRDQTPDDFVFAVKAPRSITNRAVLADAGEAVERLFASGIMALKDKLGPVNWQFMATKKFAPDDFGRFLSLLPQTVEGRPIRHAVEVRHASFRTAEFVALAREYGVAVVVAADSPYPQIADLTAPFVYLRLMGSSETEAKGFPQAALAQWSQRIFEWADGGLPDGVETVTSQPAARVERDVFLYVISGFKARNPAAAMALVDLVGAGAPP